MRPMSTKRIILLGATGSIGASALDVLRANRDEFRLVAASANTSVERCEAIGREFGARAYAGPRAASASCRSTRSILPSFSR